MYMTQVIETLLPFTSSRSRKTMFACLVLALQPPVAQGLLIQEISISHTNNSPQSVGLLWTSKQLVAETSTWQHTTLTTDRHPWPRWDSNPQSQQASGWVLWNCSLKWYTNSCNSRVWSKGQPKCTRGNLLQCHASNRTCTSLRFTRTSETRNRWLIIWIIAQLRTSFWRQMKDTKERLSVSITTPNHRKTPSKTCYVKYSVFFRDCTTWKISVIPKLILSWFTSFYYVHICVNLQKINETSQILGATFRIDLCAYLGGIF
jgi:hypothetical protein